MQPSTAPRGKLVVAHPERKAQRALHRLVGGTHAAVQIVESLEALTKVVDADTIAIVDASFAALQPALVATPARAWIAVPGEGLAPPDQAQIDALLAAGWSHVIAHPMPILAEELLATVQKLIRNDVFGLEKYVAWGAEVRSYTLEDARDREVAVAAVAADVVAIGLPERVGPLASVIADELLANALYTAPVDASGARMRASDPRDQARALAGRDAVTMRWATDGRYLAIEVRDRWGSLGDVAVGTRLASTHEQASPDGGMGLPLAYACCNQFVIASAAGKMTEVIALLDMRYKPTELGRAASFHAFTERA